MGSRMIRITTLIGLLSLALSRPLPAEPQPAEPQPAKPQPITIPVEVRESVRIPLRDGVALAATAYLPRGAPPRPCVFTLTPYVGASYHDRGMWFAGRGLPFLTVDVRGRGDSGGAFTPNLQEAADGYDVVEWLARQPWCNGKVAMWGGSYAGYDQWSTAGQVPPHLATIVPAAAPFLAVDFPIARGIIDPYARRWLALVAGRTSQQTLFGDTALWAAMARDRFVRGGANAEIVDLFGVHDATMAAWFAHRGDKAYWASYNPRPAAMKQLALPVLTITGSYDLDQPGALAHYRDYLTHASPAAAARHFLVIGPWDHSGTRTPQASFVGLTAGPPSLVDLPQLHLDWYRWTMADGSRPAFLKDHVTYYSLGAEEWRHAPTLEAVTGEHRPLLLSSDGAAGDVYASGHLGASGGAAGSDQYLYDPRDTRDADLEASIDPYDVTDQRLVLARAGRQLVYTSSPLATPLDLAGFLRLKAWIAIDQPNTDLRATVYAVMPDGRSIQLGTDRIRARLREGDFTPRPVPVGKPLLYDFDRFTFNAWRLPAGARLRLVIDPMNSIWAEKNYNAAAPVEQQTMADSRPVTVTLFHDAARPSVLIVPIAASVIGE